MSTAEELNEAAGFRAPPRPRATTRNRRLSLLPTPDEVMYVKPMTGKFAGQGRKCANCVMWYSNLNLCHVLGRSLPVDAGDICNYHIAGSPMPGRFEDTGDMQFLDPILAGLYEAPKKGTMCGNCKHFQSGRPSHCDVVVQRGETDAEIGKAVVEKGGCCNRWEQAASRV